MRLRFRTLRAFTWCLGIVVAICGFVSITNAQEQAVILRPGIMINPNQNVIYAMTPKGVAAIDLKSGAERWTTTVAAKPLTVSGDFLVNQVQPTTRSSRLELVTLDAKTGKLTAQGATNLPNSVRVGIGQTLHGSFEAEARMVDNTAFVTWRFERRPFRGRLDEERPVPASVSVNTSSEIREEAARIQGSRVSGMQEPTQGVLRMNVTNGDISNAEMGLVGPPSSRDWLLAANQKISAAPDTQYESADRRHIMASEQIADDSTWARYRWVIFDRGTSRRIGEFRTHLAFAPFVVRDSTLIYETAPYIRDEKPEPAKLRAVNLQTGQEIWSVEVRELAFRGPFPP